MSLIIRNVPDLRSRIPAASIRRGPVHSDTTYKHPASMSPRPLAATPRMCTLPLLQEIQAKPSQASSLDQDSLRSPRGRYAFMLCKNIRCDAMQSARNISTFRSLVLHLCVRRIRQALNLQDTNTKQITSKIEAVNFSAEFLIGASCCAIS
jgi:hypothetical protein